MYFKVVSNVHYIYFTLWVHYIVLVCSMWSVDRNITFTHVLIVHMFSTPTLYNTERCTQFLPTAINVESTFECIWILREQTRSASWYILRAMLITLTGEKIVPIQTTSEMPQYSLDTNDVMNHHYYCTASAAVLVAKYS